MSKHGIKMCFLFFISVVLLDGCTSSSTGTYRAGTRATDYVLKNPPAFIEKTNILFDIDLTLGSTVLNDTGFYVVGSNGIWDPSAHPETTVIPANAGIYSTS